MRAADSELQIVFVAALSATHPFDILERVPPADKLLYLQKPFHALEVQQLAVSLAARWEFDTAFQHIGMAQRPEREPHGDILASMSGSGQVGILRFDADYRLISASKSMPGLMSEMADLFVPGTHYEQILWRIEQIQPGAISSGIPTARFPAPDASRFADQPGQRLLKLGDGRCILVVMSQDSVGHSYCLCLDVSDVFNSEAEQTSARHQLELAQVMAGCCRMLGLTP
ncbi:MAG: hypothetical protein ACE5EM_06940 [Sphingomonadales bacterium]